MSEFDQDNNPSCGDSKPIRPKWGLDMPGKQLRNWPKVNGEPEKAVFLKSCSSVNMDDDMLVNMLEAYGIPALKNYPESGGFGKVVLGMSGYGTDIYVPESMYEDAKSLVGGSSNE